MEKEESVKVIPKMYLQFGQFLQTVIERSEKSIQTFYSYLYNVQYSTWKTTSKENYSKTTS